jgi:hypothetical protein
MHAGSLFIGEKDLSSGRYNIMHMRLHMREDALQIMVCFKDDLSNARGGS